MIPLGIIISNGIFLFIEEGGAISLRTEQLYDLMVIHRYGSLNAASQELNITPQALGQAIKSLEDELGVQLLIRQRHGVLFTDAALELMQAGQLFLDNVGQILAKFQPQTAQPKALHISTFEGMINDFLPDIISAFYTVYPDIKLHITSARTIEMPQAVSDRQVEFALYCSTSINGISTFLLPPDLIFTPIASAELVFIVPRKHTLAALTEPVSIKDMESYPILIPNHINMQDTLEGLRTYYDYHPEIISENNFSIYKKLVASSHYLSLGMSFTKQRQFILPAFDNVVILPITEDVRFTVGYIKAKNHHLSDNASRFLNFFQKYFLTGSAC